MGYEKFDERKEELPSTEGKITLAREVEWKRW